MGNETTITALLTAAIITGVIHTAAGPDHYLPFIAISKSRGYGHLKTILWTVVCGIGHVGSSMLIALGFMLFADLLNRTRLEWLEEWRSDIAAYAMIGMGAALLLHSLYGRWRHRPRTHSHVHADGTVVHHTHAPAEIHANGKLSYWVVFIIFVLGPCEAMLPLLTASAAFGAASVVWVSLVFSLATIATMVGLVVAGRFGLNMLRFPWLEKYAPEIAGCTVMACGLAIVCLGL
jgi:threonine/homoserine/homoserine lactone efflux protein